jgi:hypothetical protein
MPKRVSLPFTPSDSPTISVSQEEATRKSTLSLSPRGSAGEARAVSTGSISEFLELLGVRRSKNLESAKEEEEEEEGPEEERDDSMALSLDAHDLPRHESMHLVQMW